LPFGGDEDVFELEGRAPIGRVRCLRKPSRPLRPRLGQGAQWRLISHLALNHLSLVDSERGLDAIREVLALHDLADTAVTRQQVAGVTGVSSRRVAGRTGRTVALGVEVTVEFDEAHFVGGGVFLMASVLERFLGLYASVNTFSQLVATSRQREGVVKRWPPRSGERSLL
jgi:type VI secretion system protein ImpG